MMFYSAFTGGFYSQDIHGDAIPDDAVEVSKEDYTALFVAQNSGKVIIANESGHPVAVNAPPPTDDDLLAIARAHQSSLLAKATERISPLQDAVDLGIATDVEVTALAAWKTFRVKVNRVSEQETFPREIAWPAAPA